ncbi:MAG: diacylglycerol kinase family lipid kinase [Candidatus Gastranaerophilales bacterium]|nr:diacylglycerol kinase family lipid kinase [Candidatus Gastranaerophilales bacterium]
MKNVLVVSNYNAGRKQAIIHKKILHKFLLQRCQKFKFINIDELVSIDITEYDTVFAMGGDGTVSKVVKTLIEKNAADKTVAIIPCGTANLLAAKLGLSLNLKKTLEMFDKNHIKTVDVMEINGLYSVLRCGLGYDAEIIGKTPQSLKNRFGYFAYFIAGFIFAFRLKPKQYSITYDDKNLETEAVCLIIANAANMYRNFISVGNNSETDDGKFDVFVLKARNPVTFFLEFLKIIFGFRVNSSLAEYFRASSMQIKNNWLLCHIDGEKSKLKNDINIKILPNRIRMYSK